MRRQSGLCAAIWLAVSALMTMSQVNAAGMVDLEVLTEDYPPLSFVENGEVTGLATDVVRGIMERRGELADIHVVAWEDGYKRVLGEKNTALFSVVMTPERKERIQWVGPIVTLDTDFYAVKGSGIRIANLEDARRVGNIATVTDYYSEQTLKKEGFANLVSCRNEETAISKLLSGEAQLFVGSNTAMPAVLKRAGVKTDDLESVFTLSSDLAYIGFSCETPADLVADWQRTLDGMKQDGAFEKIYARWLPAETPPGRIQMVTEEYPPITFMRDGKPSGIVTDMVREIAHRLGVPDDIKLTSWKNAYNMAIVHPNIILFSTERTPEREDLFQWVGPVGRNSAVFYAKKGSGISLNTLEDAKKVAAVATTTDWFTEQYLEDAGFSNLVSSPDPADNVRQLMNEGVQLSIFTDITIPEIVSNAGYSMDDLDPVFTVSQTYFYIAVSRDTPAELVQAWQSTLDTMIQDGTFERIYRNYLPNADLEGLVK